MASTNLEELSLGRSSMICLTTGWFSWYNILVEKVRERKQVMGMKFNDFAEFYNIVDNDTLLKDYVGQVVRRASWELFERQNDIVYMAGEKGKYPELKDGARVVVREEVVSAMSWLICDIVDCMMDQYYRGIINPGEYREMLEEEFGWDYPDWEDIDPDWDEYSGEGKYSGRDAYKDDVDDSATCSHDFSLI